MTSSLKQVAILILSSAILSLPWSAQAQTGFTGRVFDATDAVLPGVTVTALHLATGNTFLAVTDGEGAYRIPAIRVGVYQVTAELPGFATVTYEAVELLVGSLGVVDFEMVISALAETVVVSGESPLIDVQQSALGGNVDSRQIEALPVNGRNWMQLTVLAPGARKNVASDAPIGNQPGSFQINLDGQQVTSTWSIAGMGSPRFSRVSIAEFELVSSRFDATQGRSMGVQVNAISKSGTNEYAGLFEGYFRHDSFNAEDPVLNRVVPTSNQQLVGAFGGPIIQDKVHFFANYEYEREPGTIISNTGFSAFNIPDMSSTEEQNYAGARVDNLLSTSSRLMIRGSYWGHRVPASGGSTAHPSTRGKSFNNTGQLFASYVYTSGRMVNELKGGYNGMTTDFSALLGDPFASVASGNAPPLRVTLQGFRLGRSTGSTLGSYHNYSVRNQVSMIRGGQELKFGGEFLLPSNQLHYQPCFFGCLDATGGPRPENIEALFPVWDDASTWNLAALSPITRSYTLTVGNADIHCVHSESCRRREPELAAWFQNNWSATPNLTLNLGVRWDYSRNGMGEEFELPLTTGTGFPTFREAQPQEYHRLQPRLGFAYALPDRTTVLRGGWGLYFAGATDRPSHASYINTAQIAFNVLNDGRANFAADPFNLAGGGRLPTIEDALLQAKNQRRGTSSIIYDGKTPYSYQTSVGFQHAFGQTMSLQMDYVWVAGHSEPSARNINLSFDPATGVNFPFTDVSHRPFPNFGRLLVWTDDGRSNYHAMETEFTKRFSDNWQASVTYTLGYSYDYYPLPINPGCVGPVNGLTMTCDTLFDVAIDLGGEYGPKGTGGIQSVTEPDQRHRLVLNGIYELPGGVQLSGLYLFSSGIRQAVGYGADIRDRGLAEGGSGRLRPDGTVIPRNSEFNPAINRVDVRLQWRLRVGRGSIIPLIEVFNLFDATNFNIQWTETSPFFRLPRIGDERTVQVGFKTTF